MIRLVGAATVLVMAASGCSTVVAGSPVANKEAVAASEAAAREDTRPLTAAEALGDYRSIDYCSLVDDTPVPADVGPVIQRPRPAYDYCGFGLRVSGFEVEVRVGYLEDPTTVDDVDRSKDPSKTPPRGLTVERGKDDSDECVRYLRFTDNMWLTIIVRAFSQAGAQAGKGDWCRVADVTTDALVRRLLAKQVGHYSFADKSVGRLDACDLVPADMVIAAVGIKDGTASRTPARHTCFWHGRAPTDPVVHLYLGVDASTRDSSSEVETVAGRRTTITPYHPTGGEYSMCEVETNHVESRDIGGAWVVVEVVLPGTDKDACAPAREIAKEVWAKLP